MWNLFYQNIKQWYTIQYVQSFTQNTYWKLNRLIQHLAKQPDWNRGYWKQKQMTSKKGTSKQTSKQLTVDSGFVKAVKMSPPEHQVGKIMVLDYQPYSVVEDRGFQELLCTLERRYQVLSRTVLLWSVIPEMYSICKWQTNFNPRLKYGFITVIHYRYLGNQESYTRWFKNTQHNFRNEFLICR